MTIHYLLAYLRMASYTVVFISSIYSLKFGVHSVNRIFWANMVFSLFTACSLLGFVTNVFEFQTSVNVFVTIGSLIWALLTFSNTVKS